MQRPWTRGLAAVLAVIGLAACGSSPAGPSGSGNSLSTPSNFRIVLQRVFFTSNEVQVAWTGNGNSYRLQAGTAPGLSDLLNTELTGTSYTWAAPRDAGTYYIHVTALRGSETSNTSVALPVYTIDLRHVIDALFFRSGPMADSPANALTNPYAAVWPDGTAIRIRVSEESGQTARANAEIFGNDFAALFGGAVTTTTELTPEDFHATSLSQVPPFTVAMRVLFGFCTTGAIACAYYGPSPVGPDRSIITMNTNGGSDAIAHEVGHAYGFGHVRVSAAVRQELNFLMNPQLVSTQMTEPEKNAIAAARAGGIAPGWRRSDALAAGLVLPFSPSAAANAGPLDASRALDRCTIVEREPGR
ncbi:MAG: hypothetical protein R2752_05740 [Vicinamibacterales bacterium]